MKSRTARNGLCGALLATLALPAAAATGADGVQSLNLGALAGATVVAGRSIQFHDASSGDPTSWEWDFTYETGVAAVDSRTQDPLWSFTDPGIWAIRLEACNVFGCSTSIKEVEVIPPCSLLPDLVLTPLLVSTAETFEACRTITAGSGFSVVTPGSVTFRAGRSVALESGFRVGGGASFRVVIDSLLDLP